MPRVLDNNISEITPEVSRLADICVANSSIEPQLYSDYHVFRGLRDLNGNGVVYRKDSKLPLAGHSLRVYRNGLHVNPLVN